MHADKSEIRLDVLLVNGTLALILGLALLYLQGMMTNLLFDIIAIVSAIVLSAAAFIMIAIVDFFAAISFGVKRLRDVAFYSLFGNGVRRLRRGCGVRSARGDTNPGNAHNLAWLCVRALGFAAARKSAFSRFERIVFYSFATASIAVSATIAALAENLDDRSSLGWIGAYLCLVGVKLLFLAGTFGYQSSHPAKLPSPAVN